MLFMLSLYSICKGTKIISHSGSYRVVMHKNRGQLAGDYIHVKHATGYSAVTRDRRYARVRGRIVYQRDTHEIDILKSLQKELGGTAEQLFPINIHPRTGKL